MYSPCEQIIDIYAEKNIKEFVEFIECKRIGKNSSNTQNNTAEWNLNLLLRCCARWAAFAKIWIYTNIQSIIREVRSGETLVLEQRCTDIKIVR